MWQLTLTLDERRAIDWVGHRYAHGDTLFRILTTECPTQPEEFEWAEPGDVVFTIPSETVLWMIDEVGQECEYLWDCFAPVLAAKLQTLCDEVV